MGKPKKKIEDRRAALAGEKFSVTSGHMGVALVGNADGGICEVQPKSAGDRGQWICISCCVAIANNWEKDSHCESTRRGKSHLIGNSPVGTPDAKHVLAWRSFVSGRVEAP